MPSLIAPASRSRVRLASIVETIRGETPATGIYKILPHLDNTALNQTQTFERSNEVKSNRQGGKQVGGNIENGGTLALPLKQDEGVLDHFESMMSATITEIAGILGSLETIAYVDGGAGNDQITTTAYDFIANFWAVGDIIITTNSTTAGNDIAATDNIRILVVAALVIDFATATVTTAEDFAAGTTLDVLSKYGSSATTRKFFTHEVTYLDLATVTFEYFRGMEVNTGTITIPTSGEVTFEMGMIGLIGLISETQFDRSNNLSGTTTVGTTTRVAAATTVGFAGSVAGAVLERGGTSAPEVESLTINVNNNRAARFAVGQQTAAFVEEGDFDVEMTFGLYFRDKTVQEQYLAGTRTDLTVVVVDQQDGHQIRMEFPTVVFTAGDKAVSGQAIVQNMTAFVEEDPTVGAKMQVWFQPEGSWVWV